MLRMLRERTVGWVALALLAAGTSACSIKKMAVNALGNAMAEAGDTYASDEDPELVAGAIPFALKTIESLLAEAPEHEGLLYAAASGFTQYAYAFVEQEADFLEEENYARSVQQRERAKKLYLRAHRYGMRGLETQFEGFADRLRTDPEQALAKARPKHVPLL
jgi:TRAP transporter T-component